MLRSIDNLLGFDGIVSNRVWGLPYNSLRILDLFQSGLARFALRINEF